MAPQTSVISVVSWNLAFVKLKSIYPRSCSGDTHIVLAQLITIRTLRLMLSKEDVLSKSTAFKYLPGRLPPSDDVEPRVLRRQRGESQRAPGIDPLDSGE